jgi:hypothetical protein
MDEEQKNINEIISELKIEDIKQEELAFECIEGMVQNSSIPENDIFPYKNEYAGIYQESKYYNPFASKKGNIV